MFVGSKLALEMENKVVDDDCATFGGYLLGYITVSSVFACKESLEYQFWPEEISDWKVRETFHSTISGRSDDALLRKFMCFQTAAKKDNILTMYQKKFPKQDTVKGQQT